MDKESDAIASYGQRIVFPSAQVCFGQDHRKSFSELESWESLMKYRKKDYFFDVQSPPFGEGGRLLLW